MKRNPELLTVMNFSMGLTPEAVWVWHLSLFPSGWEHFSLPVFLPSTCWSWSVWCIWGAGPSSPVMFHISKCSEHPGLMCTLNSHRASYLANRWWWTLRGWRWSLCQLKCQRGKDNIHVLLSAYFLITQHIKSQYPLFNSMLCCVKTYDNKLWLRHCAIIYLAKMKPKKKINIILSNTKQKPL